MPANPHRGEIEITLLTPSGAAKTLPMRPSHQAVAEVEAALGEGIVPLYNRLRGGRYGLADLAAVIAAGLRAAGGKPTEDGTREMIWRTGLLLCCQPASELVAAMLFGGRVPEPPAGEAEAPAATGPGPTENGGPDPAAASTGTG